MSLANWRGLFIPCGTSRITLLFMHKCLLHFGFVCVCVCMCVRVCVCVCVSQALKNQVQVKLSVVSCPPVTTVLIKRPDLQYQLCFSVQHGMVSTARYTQHHTTYT